eukprot:CAMPEP_0206050328 /NCGR_PEP_ID=MMETSP1466-20131121/28929_1 /ASSEMBLY_ACC=CAM_ASM_001126 /TAXON_ID=44452 /ORGANISM="Pavlova gyrans, Strain CCMP608" /LENGTH=538 /DNA_ID=CAMNT_0053425439 /DNA_START=1 /DNA_END=1613 /DNA_ORIENTATION=+
MGDGDPPPPASPGSTSAACHKSALCGGCRQNSVVGSVAAGRDAIARRLRVRTGTSGKASENAKGADHDFEETMAAIDVTRLQVLNTAQQYVRDKGGKGADGRGVSRAQWILFPEGTLFFVAWDSVLALVAFYSLFEVPAFFAFDWRFDVATREGVVHLLCNALCLLLGACHVAISLLTLPKELGRKTTSIAIVLKHNLGGVKGTARSRFYAIMALAVRILAALPLDFIGSGLGHAAHVVRCLWLNTYLARYSSYVVHLRLVKMVLLIAMQLHWVGCMWLIFAKAEAARVAVEGGTSWFDEVDELLDGSVGTLYQVLIMHSSYMLAGTILQRGMLTRGEYTLSSLVMVLGLITAGIIVSDLTMYLSQLNARRAVYQAKMDSTRSAMARMALPESIRQRVLLYYNWLWTTYGAFELDQDWLAELNPVLRSDVHIYLFRHLVRSVPFFARSTSGQLIASTVEMLKREVYLMGDIVIAKGSPGRAIYFVTAGQLHVIIEQDKPIPPPRERKRKGSMRRAANRISNAVRSRSGSVDKSSNNAS